MFAPVLALLALALAAVTALAAAREPPHISGRYLLYVPSTRLCMAPAYAADGAPLVLRRCDEAARFVLWWMPHERGGSYAYAFGPSAPDGPWGALCVDVPSGAGFNGARMQVWGCHEANTNQRMGYDVVERTTVLVGPQMSKYCLDVVDGHVYDGAPVQLWECDKGNRNQHWNHVGWS